MGCGIYGLQRALHRHPDNDVRKDQFRGCLRRERWNRVIEEASETEEERMRPEQNGLQSVGWATAPDGVSQPPTPHPSGD